MMSGRNLPTFRRNVLPYLKTEAAYNSNLHINTESWLSNKYDCQLLSEETQFVLAVPISKMSDTLPATQGRLGHTHTHTHTHIHTH